jgi:acetyl-CoA carboxylase biotin carboxyl carrier protein
MAEKDADLQRIKALIEIMEQHNLVEVEVKQGDNKILLKRVEPHRPESSAVRTVGPETSGVSSSSRIKNVSETLGEDLVIPHEEDLVDIKSPIVGTFYEAPSPDSEPYVELGSYVGPQMVVCIIEAMKVMNEIKAETSGTIVERLVTNGQAVEYGQVLFKVRPD